MQPYPARWANRNVPEAEAPQSAMVSETETPGRCGRLASGQRRSRRHRKCGGEGGSDVQASLPYPVGNEGGKQSCAEARPILISLPGTRTGVELALVAEDEVLVVHYGLELGKGVGSKENTGTKLAGASEPSITSAPAVSVVTVQTGGPA